MLSSITFFKINTIIPIMPIFTYQRMKSIIFLELVISKKVAFDSWIINRIWCRKVPILNFCNFWINVLFNFGKILLMTFNHTYISQFVFKLIGIFWYAIELFDCIILRTLSQIRASCLFILHYVNSYDCATEFLLFFHLFLILFGLLEIMTFEIEFLINAKWYSCWNNFDTNWFFRVNLHRSMKIRFAKSRPDIKKSWFFTNQTVLIQFKRKLFVVNSFFFTRWLNISINILANCQKCGKCTLYLFWKLHIRNKKDEKMKETIFS